MNPTIQNGFHEKTPITNFLLLPFAFCLFTFYLLLTSLHTLCYTLICEEIKKQCQTLNFPVFNAKKFFFTTKKNRCLIINEISRSRRDVRNAVPKKRQRVKMRRAVLKSSVTIAANTILFPFSPKPDAQCFAKNAIIPAVHGVGTHKSLKG